MFIQSSKHARSLTIFGQEKDPSVWRWCQLNSFIHGLEYDLGDKAENTFLNDLHSSIEADYILANPPFNLENWNEGTAIEESQWPFESPPKNNANYAWIQHIISKLSENGVAGIILANGSVSAKNQEKIIRQNILQANLIEGIIQLPTKLFYTTPISAVIWIIKKNRKTEKVFFLDARDFEGEMIDRKWRELTTNEIQLIANEYNNWLEDEKHFTEEISASINISEIKEKNWLLLPSLYVKKKKVKTDEEEINKEIKSICTEVVNILEELEKEKTKIVDLLSNIVKIKKF
jgi:type I restriction enzyme M protein